jgi:hypothetical protein
MLGQGDPAYRLGQEAQEAKSERRTKVAELRDIEILMIASGTLMGPRWEGSALGQARNYPVDQLPKGDC